MSEACGEETRLQGSLRNHPGQSRRPRTKHSQCWTSQRTDAASTYGIILGVLPATILLTAIIPPGHQGSFRNGLPVCSIARARAILH